MVRETASKSWAPGDAILFGESREPTSSNSTKKTTTTRQPLATLKPAKQARQQEEAVQHQRVKKEEKQTTLSPWAKAPWQPGMRVQIATQASTSTLIDAQRSVAKASKGKQREACTDAVHMHSTRDKSKSRKHSEHVPFSTTNLYDDPSTSSSPPSTRLRGSANPPDDSFSSIKAAAGGSSFQDADSSIEFLGQGLKSSPRSNALRHLALAQVNLQETAAPQKVAFPPATCSAIEELLGYTKENKTGERPGRRKVQFRRSPSSTPARRLLHTSSTVQESPKLSPFDWDDPVINPKAAGLPEYSDSDSSDLPELSFNGTRNTSADSKPSISGPIVAAPQQAPAPVKQPSASAFDARRPTGNGSKEKKLKEVGKALAQKQQRERRDASKQKRSDQDEEIKSKYRHFSYDDTAAITPKVWYFRGLPTGETAFLGCDTRSGTVKDPSKTLEEVLSGMTGALGWDLEWEPYTWNDTFTAKEVGKVALIQLGDKHNIVLYQIPRGSPIADCVLQVIEDPSIIKLGVQIRGDAKKIHRDYKWQDGRDILAKGLLDLSDLARAVHPELIAHFSSNLVSLQRLVAIYLQRYLEKGEVRTSRWESQHLDPKQRKYAANDIFASVQLYSRIVGHAETESVTIDYETLIHDLLAKLQPETGAVRSVDFRRRKAINKPRVSSTSTRSSQSEGNVTPRMREAWEKWFADNMDRDQVAEAMSVKPGTVASYIIKALALNSELPFDADRLHKLAQGVFLRADEKAILADLLRQETADTSNAAGDGD